MVHANELRIGNYFWETYGGYKIVTAIGMNNAGDAPGLVCGRAPGYTTVGAFDQENIHPIPLTPEILEKAGFKKGRFDLTDAYYLNVNNPHGLEQRFTSFDPYDLGVAFFSNRKMIGRSCESLHSLQNLYFALTGTELNINL